MLTYIIDEFLFFAANHTDSYFFCRQIVFLISDHFSSRLVLVDDVNELVLCKLAEIVEHQVPLRRQAGDLSFEVVVLVYFFDDLVEVVNIIRLILGMFVGQFPVVVIIVVAVLVLIPILHVHFLLV